MDDIKKQRIIYRAMIGWSAGMLIGVLGAAVTIIVTATNIWVKVFSGIGMFSASLALLYGLLTTLKQYKTFKQLTDEQTKLVEIDNQLNKPEEIK